MAYSLSASAANISNTFFHTPLFAQRENRVWILISKTLRQVPPWEASAKTVDHGRHKQPPFDPTALFRGIDYPVHAAFFRLLGLGLRLKLDGVISRPQPS